MTHKVAIYYGWSERDKRELRQGPTWSIQHRRAHQSRVRTIAAGPRSAWGRTMPGRESVVQSRIVAIRHTTSAIFWWFWRAISEPGWTSRKKFHLESGLNQRDEGPHKTFLHTSVRVRKPQNFDAGFPFCGTAGATGKRFNFAQQAIFLFARQRENIFGAHLAQKPGFCVSKTSILRSPRGD